MARSLRSVWGHLANALARILSRTSSTGKSKSDFDSSEVLGRGIFDSKKARQAANGKIAPRVFRERDGVREISVDRLSIANIPLLVAAHDKSRSPQTIHGWAQVSFDDAQKMNRTVVASPIISNPWHAEIVLPEADPLDFSEEQDQHALNLAMMATWRAR